MIEDFANINWNKSTCSYCGFGCGLIVGVKQGKVVEIRGMKGHPVNDGQICKLAANIPPIFTTPGRLTHPMIRRDGGKNARAFTKGRMKMKDKNNTQDNLKLQQTVRFFEALLRASADGIVITDPSKNIIFVNDTFSKIFSSNRQDLIETNLFLLLETPITNHIHPDEHDKVMERYRLRLANENVPPIYETLLLSKAGTTINIEINAGAINYHGKPADLVMIRDITERKQAEEVLKENEAFRKRVFDSSRIPIVVMDAATYQYIDCNLAAAQIYRFSSVEEVIGKNPLDVSAPIQYDGTPSPEKARFFIEKAMAQGEVIFEWHHQRPDGDIWDAEVHLMSFQSGQRQFLQFTLQDITERKRAEESLRASLEEKTILLHEVHHRVKNNLQIVSSLLSLQSTRIKNKEAIEALRETANRIQSMAMLHETLNISGNLSKVSFSTYIKKICGHIILSFGSKTENVKLENYIADIVIDLDQAVPCGLIINELVSNALKHAFPEERKGRIMVELQSLPDDQIMLTVADDGIGLPPGLDIAQTESLGLKLVTILTEKLKGSVEIIRDPETTFHIRFKANMNQKSEGKL